MFNRIMFFRHQMAEPINERTNVRLREVLKLSLAVKFKVVPQSFPCADFKEVIDQCFARAALAERYPIKQGSKQACREGNLQVSIVSSKRHVITLTSAVINLKCSTNDYLRFRLMAPSMNSFRKLLQCRKLIVTASALLLA